MSLPYISHLFTTHSSIAVHVFQRITRHEPHMSIEAAHIFPLLFFCRFSPALAFAGSIELFLFSLPFLFITARARRYLASALITGLFDWTNTHNLSRCMSCLIYH